VTLNSDDPPMFGTTLTDEYVKAASAFGFGAGEVRDLVVRAAEATLLPPVVKVKLLDRVKQGFKALSKFDPLS